MVAVPVLGQWPMGIQKKKTEFTNRNAAEMFRFKVMYCLYAYHLRCTDPPIGIIGYGKGFTADAGTWLRNTCLCGKSERAGTD